MNKPIWIAVMCAATVLHAHQSKAENYQYTVIHYPSASGTMPVAINDKGQIAGFYAEAGGAHGFIWSGGKFTVIAPPNSTSTYPAAINNEGDVVGTYRDRKKRVHGFVYRQGKFELVDYPHKYNTYLTSLNNSGVAVGLASIKDQNQPSRNVLFLYDHGSIQIIKKSDADIAYINDAGDIASADQQRGLFIDKKGTIEYVKGGRYLVAQGINNKDQIIGYDRHNKHKFVSFFYDGQQLLKLDYQNSAQCYVAGLDDSGQVVGFNQEEVGETPFLYYQGAFTMLSPPFDPRTAVPQAINNAGQILGTVYDYGKIHTQMFLATPAARLPRLLSTGNL